MAIYLLYTCIVSQVIMCYTTSNKESVFEQNGAILSQSSYKRAISLERQVCIVIEAEAYVTLRQAVREICQRFPVSYWRGVGQQRGYPEAFMRAMTEAGVLAPLIPQEDWGAGPWVARDIAHS